MVTRRWSLVTLMCGAILALAPCAHAQDAKEVKKTAPAAKLPPASEILAKFVTAIGGKEAILRHTSHHAKGKFQMTAQGIEGGLEFYAAKPDKMVVKMEIAGLGAIMTGYDGKVGWSANPATGPMLLRGKPLEQMIEQADFYNVLHDEKKYKSMETVEVTQFEGQECYKLKLVNLSGRESFEMFDTTTGLMVGQTMTQDSPLGPITATSVVSEYKKFDDVLYATKLVQKMAGIPQTWIIESLEWDKVDDTAFALPPQIKALADPK